VGQSALPTRLSQVSTPPDESSGPPEHPHIRIGTDERDAAMRALDTHVNAGRLDPDEYGDRMGKVGVARTRDDLDALFTDLPAPHPFPDGPAGYAAAGASNPPRYPTPQPYSAPVPPPSAQRSDRSEGALGGRTGATVVALSPIIALALFFATHWWVWFLLIPAMGAIVYGGGRDRRRTR
jgi:Domain of unknown function (DUF1707)